MENSCVHILKKGKNKGEKCNKNAYFPFFFPCFCKTHAEINNIPMIISETPPEEIIFQKKLYNTLAFINLFLIAFEYLNKPKNVARK